MSSLAASTPPGFVGHRSRKLGWAELDDRQRAQHLQFVKLQAQEFLEADEDWTYENVRESNESRVPLVRRQRWERLFAEGRERSGKQVREAPLGGSSLVRDTFGPDAVRRGLSTRSRTDEPEREFHGGLSDCSDCPTVSSAEADTACGATQTPTTSSSSTQVRSNSVYATDTGEWAPSLGGGCERTVGCEDYAGSCGVNPDGSTYDAASSGGACEFEYDAHFEDFVAWVYDPVAGTCSSVWKCSDYVSGTLQVLGYAGPVLTMTAARETSSTSSTTLSCEGTPRRGPGVDWPSETRTPGKDMGTRPGAGAGDESAPTGSIEDWKKAMFDTLFPGCVVNHCSEPVTVWLNPLGRHVMFPMSILPQALTDLSCPLGDEDVDAVQSPSSGRYYKVGWHTTFMVQTPYGGCEPESGTYDCEVPSYAHKCS